MPQRVGARCSECGAQAHARGLCAKHYYRLLRNGDPLALRKFEVGTSLVDKFIAVMGADPPESGCWDWRGSGSPYGLIHSNAGKGRAHRVSYRIFVGEIPEGMHVLHSCDRPVCVQPKHLSLGTHAENMRQARERGLLARKLTWADVDAIRADRRTHRLVAVDYGVHPSTIAQIKQGRTWRR